MPGAMRWPEPRGWFTPNDDPAYSLRFVRDQQAMAKAKGWGEVAPFFVELETPSGTAALPKSGRLTVNLRNELLQYAITWYGLATVLVISFFVLGRKPPTRYVGAPLAIFSRASPAGIEQRPSSVVS